MDPSSHFTAGKPDPSYNFNETEKSWTWRDTLSLYIKKDKEDPTSSLSSDSPPGRIIDSDQLLQSLGRPRSITGHGSKCRLNISLGSGVAWVWINAREKSLLPQPLLTLPTEMTLSLSLLCDGVYTSWTLRLEGERVYRNPPSEMQKANPAMWHWSFSKISASLQRMLQTIQEGTVFAQLAITGHKVLPDTQKLVTTIPTFVPEDKLLSCIARLFTAEEREFVRLRPEEDTRTVKAHKRVLMARSGYFRALLDSGWAESHAREGSVSSQSDEEVKAGTKRKRNDQEQPPVVDISEITFEELQALVFFLYTNTYLFKSNKRPDVRVDARRMHVLSPKLLISPWAMGTLVPTDAAVMYKLGDKYDLYSLKRAALNHLTTELSVQTVFRDLFASELSCLFPQVRQVYLDFCVARFDQIRSLPSYDETMQELIAGEYPSNAAGTLKTLMASIHQRNKAPPSSSPSTASTQPAPPQLLMLMNLSRNTGHMAQ